MPVIEFAGGQSWGYNPSCVFAVESDYGGPLGLKRFVKEVHRAGFGVILDVVYNHFGPSELDLWQFDGWSENGQGGIYFYNDWRAETPWGATRPDYGRNEVRQFIRDNALMWLDEYHVDGLRLDMSLYMRSVRGDGDPGGNLPDGWSLIQWINQEVHERFPGHLMIAEDLHDKDRITANVEQGGAGFDLQWAAHFVHPIRAAVITTDDDRRSSTASRTMRWRTASRGSRRRSIRRIRTVGSLKSERRWLPRWCSRHRESRCCFRDRSFSRTVGSRTPFRSTGRSPKSSAAW